jgi:16S rRNA processing protein RimM
MTEHDSSVGLGYIAGVHGLKGWVKVFSYTDPREAIVQYPKWWLEGLEEALTVTTARRQGKTIVAQLQGVSSPEQAAGLVGKAISIPRQQLPPVPEQTWYWVDLIGLAVKTTTGQLLGQVDKMIETGANDVMVVRGDRERLIPFVTGVYVQRVDLQGGEIVVDWDPDF